MARMLSQRDLRNKSGEIMRALDHGEEFIVTRNGVPVGELLPIRRRRFVPREEITRVFSATPPIDFRRFREDVDRYLDQEPAPRA